MVPALFFTIYGRAAQEYQKLDEHHVRELMQKLTGSSQDGQKVSIAYPDLFMQFHGKKILLNSTNDRVNVVLNPDFCAQHAPTIKDQQILVASTLVKNSLKYGTTLVDHHLVATYKQYQETKYNQKWYAGLEIACMGFGAISWGMTLYHFKNPNSKRFWDYSITGAALVSLSIVPEQYRESATNECVHAKQAFKDALETYVAQKIVYRGHESALE